MTAHTSAVGRALVPITRRLQWNTYSPMSPITIVTHVKAAKTLHRQGVCHELSKLAAVLVKSIFTRIASVSIVLLINQVIVLM